MPPFLPQGPGAPGQGRAGQVGPTIGGGGNGGVVSGAAGRVRRWSVRRGLEDPGLGKALLMPLLTKRESQFPHLGTRLQDT